MRYHVHAILINWRIHYYSEKWGELNNAVSIDHYYEDNLMVIGDVCTGHWWLVVTDQGVQRYSDWQSLDVSSMIIEIISFNCICIYN